MTHEPMRFAVFGTGGLGGFMGARLARAGYQVGFIARGANLAALRATGLRVQSVDGDFALPEVKASNDPAALGEADCVLVTVKTWQVEEVAQRMAPLIGPRTLVLPLLNGVEASDQLAAVLGEQRVLVGFAKIISFLAEPGLIRHVGVQPYIALGERDGGQSERTHGLRLAIAAAGITAETPQDIHAELWKKFLFVVGWGGVGAITRAPIGVLRAHPPTRELMSQAMTEIAALARARGVLLAPGTVEQTLAFIDTLPESGTASMQRDIAEGRPSELEAWNGAVVRLAAAAGIPCPVNDLIYRSLQPQELRARGQVRFE